MKQSLLLLLVSFIFAGNNCLAQPFQITAYISGNVITENDLSVTDAVTYNGQGFRWVYDRRISDWVNIQTWLYNVTFTDGLIMEIAVNPEFSESEATIEAEKYAFIIGQLPRCLREGVHSLWIHAGNASFGGGFNAVFVHTELAAVYESDDILEEVLLHESTHAALDPDHAGSAGWLNAQNSDNQFISTYAASGPGVEDLAETFVAWLAIRQCSLRITQADSEAIVAAIPNRIAYLDNQNLDLSPVCVQLADISEMKATEPLIFPNPSNGNARLVRIPNNAVAVIYSTAGNPVSDELRTEKGEIVLERNNLLAGAYYVLIQTGTRHYVEKYVLTD